MLYIVCMVTYQAARQQLERLPRRAGGASAAPAPAPQPVAVQPQPAPEPTDSNFLLATAGFLGTLLFNMPVNSVLEIDDLPMWFSLEK